jgi:glucosamine-6-phosphate deaminase
LVKTLQVDQLQVTVYQTNSVLGAVAALDASRTIQDAVGRRGTANIILATGNSQLSFLHSLRGRADIDWAKVNIFHLDEYIGLSPIHPASFSRFLKEHLIDDVKPRNFYPIYDGVQNAEQACQAYETLLRQHPINMVALGIGENGHIAFNDPPHVRFDDPALVRVVELAEASRRQQVGEGHFGSIDEVPSHAITLTIPAILTAKHILAIVPEARKAPAVGACLQEAISEARPASILRQTPHAILYLDQDSASGLEL